MEMVEADGEGAEQKGFAEKGECMCTREHERGKKDMREMIRNEDGEIILH